MTVYTDLRGRTYRPGVFQADLPGGRGADGIPVHAVRVGPAVSVFVDPQGIQQRVPLGVAHSGLDIPP